MRTTFTRRQIETVLAALLATATAVIGVSRADTEEVLGPKFLTLEKVGAFKEPVHLSQPPGVDSPLFVVERAGTVRVIDGGGIRRRPFLDLRQSVKDTGKGGEQGLLSIAFAPEYAESGLFYVAYTDNRDALRVVEFARSADDPLVADPTSSRQVLRIPQPTTKHHGGMLLFGPDKSLYIGSGDGGPSGDPGNVAQDKRVLLGKILRIDPRPPPGAAAAKARIAAKAAKKKAAGEKGRGRKGRGDKAAGKKGREREPKPTTYTIPKDNPFVGRPGRDEIFAYGLRNPWRFSFDRSPLGDQITIGDVGDRTFEEVNILPFAKARGANFGWSAFEGPARLKPGVKRSRTVQPVYSYPHNRRCSVVGGYIIRDPRLSRIKGSEVVGRYIFGDFCSRRIFAFTPRPNKVGRERSFRFRLPGVTSFAEDRAGRIYVLTYDGPVYRLDTSRKMVDSGD